MRYPKLRRLCTQIRGACFGFGVATLFTAVAALFGEAALSPNYLMLLKGFLGPMIILYAADAVFNGLATPARPTDS